MANIKLPNLCVDDPEIKEILDIESGLFIPAHEAIGSDYDKAVRLRMSLQEAAAEDRLLYVCPICGVGLRLICHRQNDDKRFYFRHRFENGNCPAITRGELTKDEIEARKYNGAKESSAHFRMKEIIAESLSHDPNFSDIKTEKVWKGQDRAKWRKPDVQAVWREILPVAFEIQLSTTFLHVIAERRLFYKAEGGLLCWIFKSFDGISARMMQDDVFFNNNHNLFLASEETLKTSKERNFLALDCRWTEPVRVNRTIQDRWNGRFISFSELTIDLEQQRFYFFDYDKHKDALLAKASADNEAVREAFELYWEKNGGYKPADDVWLKFRDDFKKLNVLLPDSPRKVHKILSALYSAKKGKVIGWDHPKFISVAHTIAGSHKELLLIFIEGLRVYNRAEQIKLEDQEKKWRKKVKEYRERIKAGDPAYKREKKFDDLISFLFPEVWVKVQELDFKAGNH